VYSVDVGTAESQLINTAGNTIAYSTAMPSVVIDQGTAQQAGWQTLPHQELAAHGIYRLWRVERWQLARRAGQLAAASALRPDWQKPRPERY
jgi:hypothetical protein